MYTRIVVGTDGSPTADQAVEEAARLARHLGASLHIVTAYRSKEPGMGQASGAPLVDTGAGEVARKSVAEQVVGRAATSWGEGLDVKTHAANGAAPDVIFDVAEQEGADLIVVGSKGMHGARRLLGSVPNSVAHGAECSVLIVKTD
jgi:nucleotide-binding universal stress UspA family protein